MPKQIHIFLSFVFLACSSAQDKKVAPTPKSPIVASNSKDSILEIQPIRIPGFETYADSLNALGDSVAVEVFKLSWETDNLICDRYEGSEGPMTYAMYRLAKSKKIIFEEMSGAYCQGDSEFNDLILFDLQGHYVWSDHLGLYAPHRTVFYKGGIEVASLQTTGEGEEGYAPRLVRETGGYPNDTTEDFFASMRSRVTIRKEGLEKLIPTLTDKAEIDEAKATLEKITQLRNDEDVWSWRNSYVLRKAGKNERAMVSRFDVNVYGNPKKSSTPLDHISYYDEYFEVIEITEDGKWYKLSGSHTLSAAKVEGWIEKKFIVPGIFEKQH